MSATNFNTENRTWRQLIGNGLAYRVPRFQRDYSWTEEEWEDLWSDLLATFPPDNEPAHYMGYLVLQTADNRNFEVIDGQQRLTTLSLIVLAAMRLIKKLTGDLFGGTHHDERLKLLRATYIGSQDPVTLTTRNKLVLNRNNDPYYRNYLTELADPLPQRGFPSSSLSMRKGFEWFEKKLSQHIRGEEDPSKALAQFVEHVSDRIFFTVITVADELNAYKVFETLNARGVRLSSTDLLKNYLFSMLARQNDNVHEVDDLEQRWESIVGRLGSESFPEFLRMHWNSRNPFERKAALFKAIRGRIINREQVFELLRAMDEDVDTWLALTQPDASSWPSECKAHVNTLRMFSVRQAFPMLIGARRVFNDSDFEKLLRATVVITFRYNIIGAQNPSELERVYHGVALHLHQKKIQNFREALEALRSIYRNDRAFLEDFAEKSIPTTQSRQAKIVRYILKELEHHVNGVDFSLESSDYTLEHVLPQSPQEGWDAFHERDLTTFVYRLGNMVMLEAKANRNLGNKSYDVKRPVYAESTLKVTRDLAATFADWTPEHLAAHQRTLARMATAIWRIAQFSDAAQRPQR